MDSKEIFYVICLTLSPNIGDIKCKKLITACGSAEAVFKEKKHLLAKIQGVGSVAVESLSLNSVFKRAEEEVAFLKKFNIIPLLFTDKDYPQRLKHCEDSPVLLYVKGNVDFNLPKAIAVVGTRKSTAYGRKFCKELVYQLASPNLLIISGLALGIDGYAHSAALETNTPTVGVLAHGLDRIYPHSHRELAANMLKNGAILSEFPVKTKPDRENFPRRNRIIAGMSDAVVVVEAGQTGGALITAEIANSYNRDVFALPGRVNDLYSKGCNRLIRNNKAALIESAEDIKYLMGWDEKKQNVNKNIQQSLSLNLNDEEKIIVDLLELNGEISIDYLSLNANMPHSKIASILLNLEFQGIVKALPGKRFTLS